MKPIFLFTLTLLVIITIKAQTNTWSVPAGSRINDVLNDSIVYRYPQFTQGFVYFKDGKISRAPLNLNRVTGEMQFISPSNDTLAVANEATVKSIVVQRDTFYFDKFFIEQLHNAVTAKLGKVEAIIQADLQKEGGYDQMSSTASISTISSLYNGSNSYKLSERIAITLNRKTIYFIGNNFNHFLPASKKNVLKMFNTKSTAIELFLKENNISFANEADLDKLVEFIAQH